MGAVQVLWFHRALAAFLGLVLILQIAAMPSPWYPSFPFPHHPPPLFYIWNII